MEFALESVDRDMSPVLRNQWVNCVGSDLNGLDQLLHLEQRLLVNPARDGESQTTSDCSRTTHGGKELQAKRTLPQCVQQHRFDG